MRFLVLSSFLLMLHPLVATDTESLPAPAATIEAGGGAEAATGDVEQSEMDPPDGGIAPASADHSYRILKNFGHIASSNTKEILAEIAGFFLIVIAGIIGGGVFGFMIGLLLYLLLRKHGFFKSPWRWMFLFNWLWPLAFAVGFALSGLIALPSILGSVDAISTVKSKRPIERMVSSIYVAIALDDAGHQLDGSESNAELAALLTKYEGVREVSDQKITDAVNKAIGGMIRKGEVDGWLDRVKHWMLRQGVEWVIDFIIDKESKLTWIADVGLLALDDMSPEAFEAFAADNGDAAARLADAREHFEVIRNAIRVQVIILMVQNILVALAVGPVPIFLVLWIFRICVKKSGAVEEL
jgi:hypothetical protein